MLASRAFLGILILAVGLGLSGCFFLDPFRPPETTDKVPPLVEVTASNVDCWVAGGRVVFQWSATDNYTPQSEITYRTMLITPDWASAWTDWSTQCTAEREGIPDGYSTFVVQGRDRQENTAEVSYAFSVECDAGPSAISCMLLVNCVPGQIHMESGQHTVVSYVFLEVGGACSAHFLYCTGQFLGPEGSDITDESGPMTNAIEVPAGGQYVWNDYTYLPPEVWEAAVSNRWQSVVLRERFYGSDCYGSTLTEKADLVIQIAY